MASPSGDTPPPGKFVTFEGGEGAGKSTQIKRLAERLTAAGLAVTTTREPGGTPTGESIRQLLLSGLAKELGVDGEAILFAAARVDHVERVIRPALATGAWVLCDRFTDSTHVYQGAVGGADEAMLSALDRVAVGSTRPDLTVVLDIPVDAGLARAGERRTDGAEADRFEADDEAAHEQRRQAFLDIAKREPDRVVVIDGEGSEDAVAEAVWQAVSARLLNQAAEA